MKGVLSALTALLMLCACADDVKQNPTTSTTGPGTGAAGGAGGSGGDAGSGATGGGSASGGSGGGGGGEPQLDWQPCPLLTGGTGMQAECVTVPMPAKRDDASAGMIDVFVKRLPTQLPKRGGLWFLAGGPGGAGVGFEQFAEVIQQFFAPEFDIYMPDHRGTGSSSRLGCPVEEGVNSDAGQQVTEAELPACVAHLQATWGAQLSGFSGIEAASDLGELIGLATESSDEHFVYGVSYGTQWAHRYLHQFPDQAAGVALDSICAPQCLFSDIDLWFNGLGQAWMGLCGADAGCSSKLTNDPWAVMTNTFANLAANCPNLDPRLTPALLKSVFAQTLYNRNQRTMIAPIVYRLNRCSAADINALDRMAELLNQLPTEPLPPADAATSGLLFLNVGTVDNYPDNPPDEAVVQAALDGYNVALGTSVSMRRAVDVYPTYPKDQYFDVFATTGTPMLMLQGDLDFIPLSAVQPVADNFNAANQHYAVLPGVPHGAFGQSPLSGGADCVGNMLADFLQGPDSVDTSCTSQVTPPSLIPDMQLSQALFGTTDAYEGDPGPLNAALWSPQIGRDLRELLQRIHARVPPL